MFKTGRLLSALWLITAGIVLQSARLSAQQPHVQRITLTEAKAKAGTAPAADLAQLSIEAAKYHRQAVQADYFPKIDAGFENLHFNKFMGQTIQLIRRSAGVPLLGKDQTAVYVNLTQPVTPVFKIKQAVNIARADEVIASAKAAQAIAQVETKVERIYFALLIAQRKQTLAEINTQMAGRPSLMEAGKDLVTARSEVAELTRSLNALLGFEPDTELELTAPEPVIETISEREATQQALANNPEIVEAEQTVVKARAATKLSKLDYVPEVAVVGGYFNQNAIPPLPQDFSYIGVIASLNLFDFGKREKIASERKTQLAMAEAGVDLVKAKVAASAQKAFLDLQRTRKIRDLTRQLAMTYQATTVSYQDVGLTAKADRAKAEEDMFQAELEYREAYAQLRRIIEGR
jgi:outer membrane protein TolC